MAQPIVYFEIVGDDAELLRRYYAALFEWEFEGDKAPRGFDYAAVRAHGVGVDGAVGAALGGIGGYLTFYVAVQDVEATLERAQRLGGARIYGPDRVNDALEIGMFIDPEGHLVGVLAAASDAAPF
jgi:predicted enzyme related to lactoylglutathione lyase